jgi:hypothetical protein
MTSPPLARLPEEIRMNSDQELIGIDAILECKILGVISLATILDWRIHYALPIYKVGGVWVATRADLQEWKKQHRDLTDIPNIMCKIEKNPSRARL